MKLIHLSDLHLGKRVNEFSMLEDQEYILTKIINIVENEVPDAVIIAGDVYDKSIPSADAVELFDDFLVRLSKRSVSIFVISGNHDCAQRIAFGGKLMEQSKVHMSPVYDGEIIPITLEDEFGKVDVFMLPFVKPQVVRNVFKDEEIISYTDAVKFSVNKMPIDKNNRNVIITHQFVTGASTCDSEDFSVGGTDNVDVTVFNDFDYVALGHIHGPQSVHRKTVRYCGTPLKYSFSEVNHEKSVTVVELFEKGNVQIKTVPLEPLRDMREIKGKFEEIIDENFHGNIGLNDYLHVTLTDEDEVIQAISQLRNTYPNVMKLDYDNKRTRENQNILLAENVDQKTPDDLFAEFYKKQNNQDMSQEQSKFIDQLIEKIWSDD